MVITSVIPNGSMEMEGLLTLLKENGEHEPVDIAARMWEISLGIYLQCTPQHYFSVEGIQEAGDLIAKAARALPSLDADDIAIKFYKKRMEFHAEEIRALVFPKD